jgi:hypothetical protein
VKPFVIALALGTAAATAQAQVGYPPAESPFRDLFYRQEATLFAGYYNSGRDPVGVAPQGGPMIGARYEVRVGGPAQFSLRAAYVRSERKVVDPTRPVEQRIVGEGAWPLYLIDLGITFNLTGQKSFHGFVPVASLGGGVASDFRGGRDIGGYRFGTPFAISIGGGIRWVPDGPFQVRVDVLDYLYQIRYPNSYFTSTGSLPPVRSGPQSVWTHNTALTIGASYQFFR